MSALAAWLRDAPWLGPGRARAYARTAAIIVILGVLAMPVRTLLVMQHDPLRRPPLTDFSLFWVAARLAAAGAPALAYDAPATDAALAAIADMPPGRTLPYFYPPPFLLLCLPLAALPYLLALFAFQLASFTAFAALLWRQIPPAAGRLAVLAQPACLIAFLSTQNGFFSAACFAAASLWLDRAPIAAGAALGLMVCKPQLALAVPLCLLAARRYTALLACGGTAVALMAGALAAFGWGTWQGFIASFPLVRQKLLLDQLDWTRLLSPYTALRLLHLPPGAALAAQGAVALAVIAASAWACRRRPGAAAEAGLMAAAAALATPHVMDYDLVILLPGAVFLLQRAIGDTAGKGFLGYEKLVLFALSLTPLLARAANEDAHLPLGCAVLMGFFLCLRRRAACMAPPARQWGAPLRAGSAR